MFKFNMQMKYIEHQLQENSIYNVSADLSYLNLYCR